jgi:hypothetical protein
MDDKEPGKHDTTKEMFLSPPKFMWWKVIPQLNSVGGGGGVSLGECLVHEGKTVHQCHCLQSMQE